MPETLPELGALAAAGALLIIAGALWVLQGLIRNSLGRLPLVGGWITTNIDGALNDARNAVLSGASASWGAAQQLFRWTRAFANNPMAATIYGFARVYDFGRNLLGVTLPSLENRVALSVTGFLATAQTYALGLYHTAIAFINTQVTNVLASAAALVTAAENRATALFDTAAVDITNALRTAEHDAAAALAAESSVLLGDIAAVGTTAARELGALAASTAATAATLAHELSIDIANAEAIAAANLAAVRGGIYTDLDTWGRQAVADAWPAPVPDVNALRGVLGQDFPWLNDLAPALAGAGAAGLLGVLIQSMAGAHAITRLATDCIVPQCRNLGGLSHDLRDLLGTASTAAVLAWLIFAVTDPAGWAAETAAVAGPVARTTADAASRLFHGG